MGKGRKLLGDSLLWLEYGVQGKDMVEDKGGV